MRLKKGTGRALGLAAVLVAGAAMRLAAVRSADDGPLHAQGRAHTSRHLFSLVPDKPMARVSDSVPPTPFADALSARTGRGEIARTLMINVGGPEGDPSMNTVPQFALHAGRTRTAPPSALQIAMALPESEAGVETAAPRLANWRSIDRSPSPARAASPGSGTAPLFALGRDYPPASGGPSVARIPASSVPAGVLSPDWLTNHYPGSTGGSTTSTSRDPNPPGSGSPGNSPDGSGVKSGPTPGSGTPGGPTSGTGKTGNPPGGAGSPSGNSIGTMMVPETNAGSLLVIAMLPAALLFRYRVRSR